MAIKLDHLKREVLRRKIAVTVNGDVDFIEIYNPTGEDRANLLAFLDSKVNTNNIDDLEKEGVEIFDMIYKVATNIEFKEGDSIKDLLDIPSEEILLVHNEIQEIVQELMIELLIRQQTRLNSIHQVLLSLEVKKKEEDINTLIREKKLLGTDEEMMEIVKELEKTKSKNQNLN